MKLLHTPWRIFIAGTLIAWSILGAIAAFVYFYAGPTLESYFAPVLIDQRIEYDATDRKPGRMCFSWFWYKNRLLEPDLVSWAISVDGTAVAFPSISEREHEGTVIDQPKTVPLGRGSRDLCVIIPSIYDRSIQLRINGHIRYKTNHGLWPIWQAIPEVKVPVLK